MDSYPSEYRRHPLPVLAICSAQPHGSATRSNLFNDWLSSLASRKSEYSLHEVLCSQVPLFRVLIVPKNYTLPQSQDVPGSQHSSLSPLTPGSELYPDGLITPAWIQRHEQIPSVVLGIYDLWDPSHEPGSPPQARRETGPLTSQVLIDPKERDKDALVTHEISERRKYFHDKGIKFVAVFVHKGRVMEDPTMEERLLLIKRQSGLDTRNAFFSLGPESKMDMQEFETNLFQAMQEPAILFYTNRIKKIRKKRSRLPLTSGRLPPTAGSGDLQPLSAEGWKFRYDYKTAFFLELRFSQEFQMSSEFRIPKELQTDIMEAIRTLENAYELLSGMLKPDTNKSRLPIRGKRWIVLADCMNIKIYTFYLCLNMPAEALGQLNFHLRSFRSYSTSWGMGEQTFEYWEWLSRQYELFAQNIDIAIHYGFKINLPKTNQPSPNSPNTSSPLLGRVPEKTIQADGLDPGTVLQHPGFYYHLAAMCCSERRRRFKDMTEAAKQASGSTQADMTARLSNERTIDHSSITIELLTKSYEQFKRFRNSRMTLYLAAEIAGTYYEAQKYDLALKFFERIAKTYRKEHWNTILTSILRWSLRCAKELGTWDRAIECLVELLAGSLPMAINKREDIQKELLALLGQDTKQYLGVEMDMDQINCFLRCQIQFEKPTSFVDTKVKFQITLRPDEGSPPLPLRFSSMRIIFSDPQYNCYLVDGGSEEDSGGTTRLEDCSNGMKKTTIDNTEWWSGKADLRVLKNQIKAIQCSIIPKKCDHVKVVDVYLDLPSSQRNVSLRYKIMHRAEDEPSSRRRWFKASDDGRTKLVFLQGRGELNMAMVMQRPPRIDIAAQYDTPALLDELFKIDVTITSQETEAIKATLQIEIKNVDDQGTDDYVTFTPENKAIDTVQKKEIGLIEPGQANTSSVYVHGARTLGVRMITLTVRYLPATNSDSKESMEKSETIRVPFVAPFDVQFELCSQNERVTKPSLPTLSRTEQWLLVAAIRCCSTTDLKIQSIQLNQDTAATPGTTLSLVAGMDSVNEQTWSHNHVYNVNYLFKLSTADLTETPPIPIGSLVIDWQKSAQGDYFQTVLQLPSLTLQQQKLVVIADIPSDIRLDEPCTLAFTVHNPTVHLVEYTASIELSDAFVFSGYKQLRGRVLPLSHTTYHYRCYPLQAGKVRLPRLKVIATQQGAEKEVPVEMHGDGAVLSLGGDLHVQITENDVEQQQQQRQQQHQQQLLTFVNARRHFDP